MVMSPPTTAVPSATEIAASSTGDHFVHLFIPRPLPHEPSELPSYVAGPSAASLLGPKKLAVLPSAPEGFVVTGPSEPPVWPSAPPGENDQAAASSVVVPSAPPMLEDGELQQGLVLSAPPLTDGGHAGPSAPSPAT
ncbi:hypothetical protein FRC00_005231 [Tulasnella sp. 408]|nr:hypothetical protein FRC00_005231 [Tulasnella sp. 408]